MGRIQITHLGKAYKQYPGRWSRLAEWLSPVAAVRHQLKWVLKDINFHVAPGEAVGIVGINGAGKSTLLKLITGTAQASTGQISISGRVAALLELGMGFHPDFTGRQNVIMAGQLLGMTGQEVIDLMPQIEAFAEIGEYIDSPVRVYSSGMQMRLAFSVATARQPDILIVDEALSVGDAYFQHKSFQRIRQFQASGTTLLLVSHDRAAILAICNRVILLDKGELLREGTPEAVMDYYNALLAAREDVDVRQSALPDQRMQTISGSGEVAILDVALLDGRGAIIDTVATGAPVTVRLRTITKRPIPRLVAGFLLKDRLGQPVFGTNTHHLEQVLEDLDADAAVEFRFSFAANLGPGSYSIAVALTDSETHLGKNFEWRDLALVFKVVNLDKPVFDGGTWLESRVSIERGSAPTVAPTH